MASEIITNANVGDVLVHTGVGAEWASGTITVCSQPSIDNSITLDDLEDPIAILGSYFHICNTENGLIPNDLSIVYDNKFFGTLADYILDNEINHKLEKMFKLHGKLIRFVINNDINNFEEVDEEMIILLKLTALNVK